jgi:TonB-dependent receptor
MKTPTFHRAMGLSLCAFLVSSFPYLSAQTTDATENGEEQSFDLEDFNVYSTAQESALTKKQESERIGSFLDADAIGNLPDDTLGEALTRLPGVNVVDGQVSIRGVEGRLNNVFVNGSGLSQPNLGLSTGLGGDTRNFDVSSIPAESVAGVEVIKALTADLPGDSIGGIVNVITSTGLEFPEQKIKFKAETRYYEEGGTTGHAGTFFYGGPLSADKNVGMTLNLNYQHRERALWSMEYDYYPSRLLNEMILRSLREGFEFDRNRDPYIFAETVPEWDQFDPRDIREEEDKVTLSASFDFKVSESTTLYFRPWVQLRNRDYRRYRLRFRDLDERKGENSAYWFFDEDWNIMGEWEDRNGDGVLGNSGDLFHPAEDDKGLVIVTPRKESNDLRLVRRFEERPDREENQYRYSFGGTTIGSRFTLDYEFNINKSTQDVFQRDAEFDPNGNSIEELYRWTYDFSDRLMPTISAYQAIARNSRTPVEPRVDAFSDGFENSRFRRIRERTIDSNEDAVQGQINLKYNITGTFELKTGLWGKETERRNRDFIQDWEAIDIDSVPTYADYADVFYDEFSAFDNFYGDVGPWVPVDAVFAHFEENPDLYQGDYSSSNFVAISSKNYNTNERIYASYLMATKRFDALTVIAGVRGERTRIENTWKPSAITPPEPGLPILEDVSRKRTYDTILPSASANYRFGDHVLRAAISSTIARPDYDMIVPYDNRAIRDAWGSIISTSLDDDESWGIGNPNLQEQTATNYDLSWEWYYRPGAILSVTGFYKDISDFIYPQTIRTEFEYIDDDGNYQSRPIETRFFANGGEQTIYGVEFSWSDELDWLPQALEGFRYMLNYTWNTGEESRPIFAVSSITTGVPEIETYEDGKGLTNQPEHIVNAQLIWERGPLNIRATYNYVDRIARNVLDRQGQIYQEGRDQVDLSFQYRLNKNLRLVLDVKNVFEEPLEVVYDSYPQFMQEYDDGHREWVLALSGSF